jgi:hypothetical protein
MVSTAASPLIASVSRRCAAGDRPLPARLGSAAGCSTLDGISFAAGYIDLFLHGTTTSTGSILPQSLYTLTNPLHGKNRRGLLNSTVGVSPIDERFMSYFVALRALFAPLTISLHAPSPRACEELACLLDGVGFN